MGRFLHLTPLLLAAAILFVGNGIMLTLITIRAGLEGFSPAIVGLMGTFYFGGFLLGSIFGPRLIELVGHVRVFAALAALGGGCALIHILYVDPIAWMGARAVAGFCIAGLFTVIESWLNSASDNRDRGRVLSIYSLIDLGTATSAQFMLPLVGPSGFEIFAIAALFFTFSLVPLALTPAATPAAHEPVRLAILDVWRISPLAFITCFTIGLTNSSYRAIGPFYATEVGLDLQGVATFMAAGIIGGAVLQLPLGYLSDRIDRRIVLIIASLGATICGLFVASLSGSIYLTNTLGTVIRTETAPEYYYLASFLFGAFAMPLYSLAAAHANDHAKPGQYAVLSAGLLFTFGIAATVGPLASSTAMEFMGPPGLFAFISVCHAGLVISAIVRMRARAAVPEEERATFTVLPRTSTAIFRLARKRLTAGNNAPPASATVSDEPATAAGTSR